MLVRNSWCPKMKKTFKPLIRVEKAFQTYRKKTLGVNDNLNIKHDSDEMENLQEYWSTAMSVIGESTIETIDDTVATEQSDTLFNINNIRKSIRENNAEALYKKSINKSKKGDEAKTDYTEENTENLSNVPEKLSDDSDSRVNLVELEKELVKEGKMEPTSVKNLSDLESFVVNPTNSNLANLKDKSVSLKEIDSLKYEHLTEEKQNARSYEVFDGFEMEHNAHEFNEVSSEISLPVEKKLKKSKTASETAGFQVSTVSMLDGANTVIPLVCSRSMETGFINLKHLAYIDLYKSKNSFSLFVTKGKLEMVKNGEKKILKKGMMAVIEKGDVYSLACISENGACVVLSFSL